MTDSSTGIRKMYMWSANFGLWIHLRALGFSIKGFYKQLVEILKLWPWASKLSSTGQSNGSAENCPLGVNMLGNMKRVQIRCFPRSSQTRATAYILSYLKEVWGVTTFDFFRATETWSVFNALQFSPFISWQNVAMFCRQLQSSKKFNRIVFTTLSTSPSDSQQLKRTAI